MDFVAIDFETANSERNSACAIGITPVKNGVVGETIERLIRPPKLDFGFHQFKKHGITESQVINEPTFCERWPEVSSLIEGSLVVAHNTSFDISVLRHTLHAAGLVAPRFSFLCSLRLSEQLWPQLASHSLGFIAATFSIPLEHHKAGSDSRAAAQLVLLGAKEKGINCPRELAASCGLSIGEVFSNDNWTPSSRPSIRGSKKTFAFQLPHDFDPSTHEFFGKLFVFTGTMATFTKPECKEIVTRLGGIAKDSVSKKIDYVVTGTIESYKLGEGKDEYGKMSEAKALREKGAKVKIITDSDFMEMISTVKQD